MCCIRGICILAPGANVSANVIFHPVYGGIFISISCSTSLQCYSAMHTYLIGTTRACLHNLYYDYYQIF